MNKASREVYRVLATEVNGTLCTFCRYSTFVGPCEESYPECEHPIEAVIVNNNEEVLTPGDDCWGFRPAINVSDTADVVGLVLANNWGRWAWMLERRSPGRERKIEVEGRSR